MAVDLSANHVGEELFASPAGLEVSAGHNAVQLFTNQSWVDSVLLLRVAKGAAGAFQWNAFHHGEIIRFVGRRVSSKVVKRKYLIMGKLLRVLTVRHRVTLPKADRIAYQGSSLFTALSRSPKATDSVRFEEASSADC